LTAFSQRPYANARGLVVPISSTSPDKYKPGIRIRLGFILRFKQRFRQLLLGFFRPTSIVLTDEWRRDTWKDHTTDLDSPSSSQQPTHRLKTESAADSTRWIGGF